MALDTTKEFTKTWVYKEGGAFLRTLRERQNESCETVAKALKTDRNCVYSWEHGRKIPLDKFAPLVDFLEVSEADRKNLFDLYYPKAKGLDDVWLAAQPLEKQGGLLLQAFRLRAHMKPEELANDIFVSRMTIVQWEAGKIPINLQKLGDIKQSLKLSDEEFGKLTVLARQFQKHGRGLAIEDPNTQLGAAFNTAANPKLLPTKQQER